MLMNEQIRASEVELTGLNGESLGVLSRVEALALARRLKADLVCTSLFSSPPPCRLMAKGAARQQASREQKAAQQASSAGAPVARGLLEQRQTKEIRLTAGIGEHDLDTKRRQAEKLLESGKAVQLVVKLSGKEGPKAKELLERLVAALAACGKKETGIQISGKQAAVKLNPL